MFWSWRNQISPRFLKKTWTIKCPPFLCWKYRSNTWFSLVVFGIIDISIATGRRVIDFLTAPSFFSTVLEFFVRNFEFFKAGRSLWLKKHPSWLANFAAKIDFWRPSGLNNWCEKRLGKSCFFWRGSGSISLSPTWLLIQRAIFVFLCKENFPWLSILLEIAGFFATTWLHRYENENGGFTMVKRWLLAPK